MRTGSHQQHSNIQNVVSYQTILYHPTETRKRCILITCSIMRLLHPQPFIRDQEQTVVVVRAWDILLSIRSVGCRMLLFPTEIKSWLSMHRVYMMRLIKTNWWDSNFSARWRNPLVLWLRSNATSYRHNWCHHLSSDHHEETQQKSEVKSGLLHFYDNTGILQ